MIDLTIALEHRPGALAELGEALGRAGVSIEGGGVFASGGMAVAHYLFDDDAGAGGALRSAGFRVTATRPVVTLCLRQAEPGQLGRIARLMADAGVNIDVQYSDHHNRLILVVDDPKRAQEVADAWTSGRESPPGERT
jgi:hypothetical protein